MGTVLLHRDDVLLGRFPSPHAAARWVIEFDPPSCAGSGSDWSLRMLRAWASRGGRSFVHERDAAPPPTALHREAEPIREVGWSG